MPSPSVSVIIPVYDSMPYLEQALESLKSQTTGDFEVICVDDGSNDDSFELMKRYRDDDAFPDLKIITQRRLGPGAARNRGLDAASGRYVLFLDSDDVLEPDAIARALERADALGCDVVCWDAWELVERTQRDRPAAGVLPDLAAIVGDGAVPGALPTDPEDVFQEAAEPGGAAAREHAEPAGGDGGGVSSEDGASAAAVAEGDGADIVSSAAGGADAGDPDSDAADPAPGGAATPAIPGLEGDGAPSPAPEVTVFSLARAPEALFAARRGMLATKLFRRSHLIKMGVCFPALFCAEDLPFAVAALLGAQRMSIVGERLTHLRARPAGSVATDADRHPLDIIEAYAQLHQLLQDARVLDRCRVAYARWALAGMVERLNAMTRSAAFSRVFEALRRGGLERTGMLDVPREAFPTERERRSLEFMEAGDAGGYLFFWMHGQQVAADQAEERLEATEAARDELLVQLEQSARELAQARDEAAGAQDGLEEARRLLDEVCASAEYRIGCALMRIPRALQRRLRS